MAEAAAPSEPPSRLDRRFWLSHALLPALLLLGVVLLSEFTDLQFRLLDRLFDFQQHRWIYGESWWANTLIHQWGRNLIALIFIVSLVLWLASMLFYKTRLRHWRHQAGFVALAILLTTGLVGLGKKITNVDCPWDLAHYNGNRPYVPLFADKPDTLPRGRCFPGGHSSGAFALLVFYFLWRDRHRRRALISLVVVSGLGLVYAWGQWVRGAHFPSHDLWSAAVGWYVSLALYVLYFRNKLTQQRG